MKNNKHNNNNLPTLRFPEFSGEWKECIVSDFIDFYSTNSLSWEQLDYEDGEIYNLHYGLIHKGTSAILNIKEYVLPFIKRENTPKSFTLCNDGDIAFADASEDTNDVAKVVEFMNCNNSKTICGLHTIHGRDKLGITHLGYKAFAFSSPKFKTQIRRIAQGTKVFSISIKNFDELHVGIPSLGEQNKIVSFLSLIDERIATQNKIIAHLESLIKGLNNYLHSKYGNDILISLADIGQTFSGLSGKSAEDFGNGEPYITYLNVYQNDIIDDSAVGYVSIQDDEIQNKVSYGDVLFSLSSETANEVGIASVYLSHSNDKYLNSFCFGYRLNDFQILTPEYLPYCFSSTRFRKHILPFAQGSTRYNLQKSDFMKSTFRIPTMENQVTIANIMFAYNRKLTTDKHLLVRYEEQKSYLLQKLFI